MPRSTMGKLLALAQLGLSRAMLTMPQAPRTRSSQNSNESRRLSTRCATRGRQAQALRPTGDGRGDGSGQCDEPTLTGSSQADTVSWRSVPAKRSRSNEPVRSLGHRLRSVVRHPPGGGCWCRSATRADPGTCRNLALTRRSTPTWSDNWRTSHGLRIAIGLFHGRRRQLLTSPVRGTAAQDRPIAPSAPVGSRRQQEPRDRRLRHRRAQSGRRRPATTSAPSCRRSCRCP